jgi:hypothetical protein
MRAGCLVAVKSRWAAAETDFPAASISSHRGLDSLRGAPRVEPKYRVLESISDHEQESL